MGSIIQKRFEKMFKALNEDTNSYLKLLISGNCSNMQVENEHQKDFLLLCKVLAGLSQYLSCNLKV
jgi:hypothetical protein